jgi:hypothetical protein
LASLRWLRVLLIATLAVLTVQGWTGDYVNLFAAVPSGSVSPVARGNYFCPVRLGRHHCLSRVRGGFTRRPVDRGRWAFAQVKIKGAAHPLDRCGRSSDLCPRWEGFSSSSPLFRTTRTRLRWPAASSERTPSTSSNSISPNNPDIEAGRKNT